MNLNISINILIVRDKARAICELLSDANRLNEEREFARKNREKFMGISSTGPNQGSSIHSAAPASGKYGGFGSKDLEKYGAPNMGGSSSGNVYDPYVNKSKPNTASTTAVSTKQEYKSQPKKRR